MKNVIRQLFYRNYPKPLKDIFLNTADNNKRIEQSFELLNNSSELEKSNFIHYLLENRSIKYKMFQEQYIDWFFDNPNYFHDLFPKKENIDSLNKIIVIDYFIDIEIKNILKKKIIEKPNYSILKKIIEYDIFGIKQNDKEVSDSVYIDREGAGVLPSKDLIFHKKREKEILDDIIGTKVAIENKHSQNPSVELENCIELISELGQEYYNKIKANNFYFMKDNKSYKEKELEYTKTQSRLKEARP